MDNIKKAFLNFWLKCSTLTLIPMIRRDACLGVAVAQR
jgi:hypothetical protein